jgi:hypothetical protein
MSSQPAKQQPVLATVQLQQRYLAYSSIVYDNFIFHYRMMISGWRTVKNVEGSSCKAFLYSVQS